MKSIVVSVQKREDELKQLKSEVAPRERKIQLQQAPPKPKAIQFVRSMNLNNMMKGIKV